MRRILSLAAVLLAAASTTWCSVVEDLTLERALELSSDVVVGVVIDSESDQTASGAIYTDWTVRVDDVLEGDTVAGDVIMVRHWGGVLGGVGMLVVGEPQFELGERLVLLLESWRDSDFKRTVGLFQGAYSVVEEDGVTWAIQKPAGSTVIARPQQPADRLPQRIGLQTFLEAIRDEGRQP